MKIKTIGALPALLLASVFVLSACNAVQAGNSEPQIELPQIYEFPGFGYSIDYPAGWTASTRQAYTIINELEDEHQRAFSEGATLEGYSIGFEHRPLDFLYALGLSNEATLEGLFEFNNTYFRWPESEIEQTTLFGEPAISLNVHSEGGENIYIMGFVNEEAYLMSLSASTGEALDAFLPTWNAMLASAKTVGE